MRLIIIKVLEMENEHRLKKILDKLNEIEDKLNKLNERLGYIETYLKEKDAGYKPFKDTIQIEEGAPKEIELEKEMEVEKETVYLPVKLEEEKTDHRVIEEPAKEEEEKLVPIAPSYERVEVETTESETVTEGEIQPSSKVIWGDVDTDFSGEGRFADLESEPRDIELTIGSSLFQRLGILFIIVSSILATYWLYSAIILYLPLYVKVAIVSSFGVLVVLAGIKLSSSDLPRWYAEGLTSSGVAILFITTFISYYPFKIINITWASIAFLTILVTELFIAKKFNFKGLIIESLLGAILVGIIVAWNFPNYPYSQVYTVALFIIVFQRMPIDLKDDLKIMVISFLVIEFISVLQGFLIYSGSLVPHSTLQLVSLLSPAMIYWAFESREAVNRLTNQWISWLSILLNFIIFGSPVEFLVIIVSLHMLIAFLVHRFTNVNLPINSLFSDLFMSLLTWLIIAGRLEQSLLFTLDAIKLYSAYIGLIPLLVSVAKIKLEKKFYEHIDREPIGQPISFLLSTSFYVSIALISMIVGSIDRVYVAFLPLLIYVILKYIRVNDYYNNTIGSISYLLILIFIPINHIAVIASYIAFFMILLKFSGVQYVFEDPLSLVLLSFLTIIVQAKITVFDPSPLSVIPIYTYLCFLVFGVIRNYIRDEYVKSFGIFVVYIAHILPFLTIDFFRVYGVVSLITAYLISKLSGFTNRVNDYILNASLVFLMIYNLYTQLFIEILLYSAYITSLGLRTVTYKVKSLKFDQADFILTIGISFIPTYLISFSSNQFLIEMLLLSIVTINILNGFLSNNQLIQALSTYAYIGLSSLLIKGINILGLNIMYIIYFYVFLTYLSLNFITRNKGLTIANMLGYPAALILIYAQGFTFLIPIASMGIPYLIGFQTLSHGDVEEELGLMWFFSKIIFMLSTIASSLLVVRTYSLSIYGLNLLLLVYLSKRRVFNELESHLLPVMSSSILMFLEYYTPLVSPIILFTSIYANLALFTYTRWIKHSGKIVLFMFPYQLTYGYLTTFSTVPYIDISAIITLGLLAVLIALQKPNIMVAINNVIALSIIGFSQGSQIILSGLILVYIFSFWYAYHDKIPITLLTLIAPVGLFIYKGLIFPHLSAVLGLTYLISTVSYRRNIDESKLSPFDKIITMITTGPVTIGISFGLYYVTLILISLDVYFYSVIFMASLFIATFFIDFAFDVEQLSQYTLLASLGLIGCIIYKFGPQIETTIYIAIVAVLTIVFGILTDRSNTRKVGVLSMLGVSFKGVVDIFIYVTFSNLSIFLKIAIGFLLLGLVLLLTSYLYLKFYIPRKIKEKA